LAFRSANTPINRKKKKENEEKTEEKEKKTAKAKTEAKAEEMNKKKERKKENIREKGKTKNKESIRKAMRKVCSTPSPAHMYRAGATMARTWAPPCARQASLPRLLARAAAWPAANNNDFIVEEKVGGRD
jgi:hypothetical protein